MAHAAATITDSPIHEANERVTFANAALGVAGHEVTDPVLRALLERVAREELSDAEAMAKMRRQVQG